MWLSLRSNAKFKKLKNGRSFNTENAINIENKKNIFKNKTPLFIYISLYYLDLDWLFISKLVNLSGFNIIFL